VQVVHDIVERRSVGVGKLDLARRIDQVCCCGVVEGVVAIAQVASFCNDVEGCLRLCQLGI
jgi:hypothetical protein